MKFYVHYELAEPEFTLPITNDGSADSRTVNDVKNEFISAYNTRFPGKALQSDLYCLSFSRQKVLTGSDPIATLVKPNTDLYLAVKKGDAVPKNTVVSKAAPTPRPPMSAARETDLPNKIASVNITPPTKVGAVKPKWTPPSAPNLTVHPQVKQWVDDGLAAARKAKEKGFMRQACEAWRQILAVSPGNLECLTELAKAAGDLGRLEEAVDFWSQVVALEAGSEQAFLGVGKAALGLRDWGAALAHLTRAMEIRIAGRPHADCDDLKVLLGQALYGAGQHDAALGLITAVLQSKEDNADALVAYARAFVDRSRPADAVRILLKALVGQSTHPVARAMLADIAAAPGGVQAVCGELGEAAQSAAALAFIATLIKDNGAVEASVALYYLATAAAPTGTTYWLNLAHTLEAGPSTATTATTRP